MADLKEFRRKLALLKKQGLISGSTQSGEKIDARSALPGWKVKGKRLDTLVSKYDDVASGKATALKVAPSELKKFRKIGFETAQGRVIVPHSKIETAKLSKGQVSIKSKSGIERVQIPVEFHNLNQYLTDIEKNAPLIDAMKKNNEYFGVRFYGGQRAKFYSSVKQLISNLRHYESIKRYTSKSKQAEVYQNLEIIKMTKPAALRVEEEIDTRRRKMTAAYNRRHAAKVYARRKAKGPAVMKQFRKQKAELMREYRQRLKRNPAADAHYKKQAKARAAKSRTRYAKKRKKKTTKRKGKKK